MSLPRKNGVNPFAGKVDSKRLTAFTTPSQLRQEPVKNDYRQADPLNISLQPSVNPQYQPRKGGLSIGVEEADQFSTPIDPLDDEKARGARNAAMLSMPSPGQLQDPLPSPVMPQPELQAPPLAQNTNTTIVEDDSLDSIELDDPKPVQQAPSNDPIKTGHGDHKSKHDAAINDNNDFDVMQQSSATPTNSTNGAGKKKTVVRDGQAGDGQTASIALSLASISAVFGIPALCISIGAMTGRLQFGFMLAGVVFLSFAVTSLVLGVISLARNKMKKAISVTAIILSIVTITATALLFFYGWTTVQEQSVYDEKMQDISRCLGDSQNIISNGERDNPKWNCSNYSD